MPAIAVFGFYLIFALHTMMKNLLFLFGTRPEAIKLAPLIALFKKDGRFRVTVGVTAQHREMLDQILSFFEITPDFDLDVMKPGQSLHDLTGVLITRITDEILSKGQFDLVFVQGDTTTVFAGALSAFYQKIPVAHVEAGLRSHNLDAPFPEEMNRILTSRIATLHFCPTESARRNLLEERIEKGVYVTGNTVIDALYDGLSRMGDDLPASYRESLRGVDTDRKIIMVTCHRRESFGDPLLSICDALMELAARFRDTIQIVFPMHPNPNLREIAIRKLSAENILLTPPLDYPALIWLMDKSHIILTDSGGIQEEAPALGKPVLILRSVTERMESVESGLAKLVGAERDLIVGEASRLLDDDTYYASISRVSNPYGDGTSCSQILDIVAAVLNVQRIEK